MFSVDEDGTGSRTEPSAKWENQEFFLPSPTQMTDEVSSKVTIPVVDVIIPILSDSHGGGVGQGLVQTR